ncbi:hydroxyacylglutathione hydrolase [Nisaea acidiphila]|uniref:Hydroxyacylglutathione hydrolase n=1 Tax=Nisaea acidiphila TaxID=1862145 RepID=A0A9J7AKG1_9PROT|nr:hydroxyacylglutathione hydrolase [Nisaea acidiphila]UUX48155.1 hydroxyacylglutathione hydrolase [Nisaea acidiphila]
MSKLDVVLVPARSDNYVYLLHDADSGSTAVVDPGAAAPVIEALEARGWKADLIINTHHHGDHTEGNEAVRAKYGCKLAGPKSETARIAGMDITLAEGDSFDFAGHKAEIFETPGHTSGHIAFFFPDSDILLSGDTLFVLGCGRVFEGTMEQMWSSLKKLRALPPATRIYCGHEYTQSNARFALSVDGENAKLQAQASEIDRLRADGQPTVPSTIGDELDTNPFLRADSPALAAAVGMEGADPVAVFAEVRKRKDNF